MQIERKWVLAVLVVLALAGARRAEAEEKGGGMLVHNVFFRLKDSSPAAREKFIASCRKHLTKHPGEVFFAVGPIVEDLKRPVNDRDFDVCLTIVFKDRASHDQYQEAKRHKEFIEENKAQWAKVRVFDSYSP